MFQKDAVWNRKLWQLSITYGDKMTENFLQNYPYLHKIFSKNNISMFKVSHKKSYFKGIEFPNFQILHNLCLFSSSCLCPVGCLSFVL